MEIEWEIFEQRMIYFGLTEISVLENMNVRMQIMETFKTEQEAIDYVSKKGWGGCYYFIKKIFIE